MRTLLFIAVIFIFNVLDIYAQEITVFPGFWGMKYYQNSDPISAKEVGDLMKEFKYSNELWKKSKTQKTVSLIALGAQLGFTYYFFINLYEPSKAKTSLIGNLITGAAGIGFSIASQNSQRKAILSYNKLKKESQDKVYYLSPSSSGLGLAINF